MSWMEVRTRASDLSNWYPEFRWGLSGRKEAGWVSRAGDT